MPDDSILSMRVRIIEKVYYWTYIRLFVERKIAGIESRERQHRMFNKIDGIVILSSPHFNSLNVMLLNKMDIQYINIWIEVKRYLT